MANYDKLTDLPNRRYLLECLAEYTAKEQKTPFALFFIDLDNFKQVNDNAGHDAGDALLQRVALYLQNAHENSGVFRPGPGSLNVAARVGGDEFILIIPSMSEKSAAESFADEIVKGFHAEPVDKYIDKYGVGLSIGVALYPEHTENYHVLIKYADIAMYHAKRAGKNRYRVYYEEMEQKFGK
jgi:diguanylate cyclase (GGDEF)-like protein